ncbi:hypothetical protein GX411_02115 [Candidatus Fermentibacteria bacterium]|nr:hypothetical protein [Candidatus Fermentibacteria bacterium]
MPGSAPDRISPGVIPAASLLLALTAAAFVLRSWFSTGVLPPPPRMQGETTQAFRYTQMVSNGEDIPAVDSLVMYPGGMRTGENSIFEEYLAGWLHRLVGGDFQRFLRFFCLAFPLLSLPGIFLWLRVSGMGFRRSLLSAQIYGFFLPAVLRARGESFYRETVAMPLLVLTGLLSEAAMRSRGGWRAWILSLAAPAALFASLAAWKVSTFLALLLLFYILARNSAGSVPRQLPALAGASFVLASLLLSHMRSDGAATSPAMAVAVLLILSSAVRWRFMPFAALALAAVAAALGSSGATGHVTGVLEAKLRFMLMHPADPGRLSPDARLFWVAGYETPSPGQVILLFGIPLVAAVFGARRLWESGPGLIGWLLPASLAGYVVFDRLHVLLAVAIVPAMVTATRRSWKLLALSAALGLEAAAAPYAADVLSGAGLPPSGRPSLLTEAELGPFLGWLQRETGRDEPVLSYWHLSGLISAYADRPVVTHTFFESEANRRTIQEFAGKLFQPEDSLVSFMESRRCSLVVYQADFLLDRSSGGVMYLAGLLDPPPECAALCMHYHPERLRRLALVYQGPSLRVFSLNMPPEDSLTPQPLFDRRHARIFDDYDKALALVSDPVLTALELAGAGRSNMAPDLLSASLSVFASSGGGVDAGVALLQELTRLHLQGLYSIDNLAADFRVYQSAWGPDPELTADLGTLYESAGRMEDAAEAYASALAEAPWLEAAAEGLRRIEAAEGREAGP